MKIVIGEPKHSVEIVADLGNWPDFSDYRRMKRRYWVQPVAWWLGLSLNSGLFIGLIKHQRGFAEFEEVEGPDLPKDPAP